MAFHNKFANKEQVPKYFVYAISELSKEYTYGYLACSKSYFGFQLLKQIDDVLKRANISTAQKA